MIWDRVLTSFFICRNSVVSALFFKETVLSRIEWIWYYSRKSVGHTYMGLYMDSKFYSVGVHDSLSLSFASILSSHWCLLGTMVFEFRIMCGTNGSNFQPYLFPVDSRWPDWQKPYALVHLNFSDHIEKAGVWVGRDCHFAQVHTGQASLLSVGKGVDEWVSKGLHFLLWGSVYSWLLLSLAQVAAGRLPAICIYLC